MADDLRAQIKSQGPTAALVKEAILEIARALFADTNRIRDTSLKNYVWSEDKLTNKILIEASGKFKLEGSGMRLGIFIKYSGTNFIDIAQFGNLVALSGTTQTRAFLANSKYEIRCIGKTEMEVLHLASEISIRLREVSLAIAKDYTLKVFDLPSINPVSDPTESMEWIISIPVTVLTEHGSQSDRENLPERLGTHSI